MIRTSIAAAALVIAAAAPGFAQDCERGQANATPVTPYAGSYQSAGDFRTDGYRTDGYRTGDSYRADGYHYRYRYHARRHYGSDYGSDYGYGRSY